MKKTIMFVFLLLECLLVMPRVYAADLTAPTIEAGTGEAYNKQATDLGTGVEVKDGKVTGTLNYVDSYDGFATGAKGYFLYLKVTKNEGITYKFDVKGPESESEGKYVNLGSGDDKIVAQIKNTKQTIEIVAEKDGKEIKMTLDLSGLVLKDKPTVTIEIPGDDEETTLGDKIASDLQKGVSFKNGKFKGNLYYVDNFDEFAEGASGYFLFFKVTEAAEQDNTVEVALSGEKADHPDAFVKLTEDMIFIAKINSVDETIKVRVTNKQGIITNEEYSLSDLVLKTEDDVVVPEKKPSEKDKNPKTGDSLMTYIVIASVTLVESLGIGMYLKRINN